MRADMHVIITINSDLAEMVHDASWIMVDTTFAVVHGTTNEWKLLIWLNSLDKHKSFNVRSLSPLISVHRNCYWAGLD